jgi:hypothetical protein
MASPKLLKHPTASDPQSFLCWHTSLHPPTTLTARYGLREGVRWAFRDLLFSFEDDNSLLVVDAGGCWRPSLWIAARGKDGWKFASCK